jgi:hypothetical protein
MKTCDKLYIGFRKYVLPSKLDEFDRLYFSRKSLSPKFITNLIYNFVDVEGHIHNLNKPEEIKLFTFFKNDYVERHKPLNKKLREIALTPITSQVNFLFKNPI